LTRKTRGFDRKKIVSLNHLPVMLREIVLRVLKTFNPGTIKIRHPFTRRPFYLDAYKHKGYWYQGKKTEQSTFDFFKSMISETDTVIEVGGHIGYMSVYLSELVGENGKVFVFEPGVDNLKYLKKNIAQLPQKNTVVIEKAVSEKIGKATFFMENITGQNNSLVYDHIGPNSHVNLKNEKNKSTMEVNTIDLDHFIEDEKINHVDFLKIDIEAAEYEAFLGMQKLIEKFKPTILMEVTRHQKEIYSGFLSMNYLLFNSHQKPLTNMNYSGNIFAIHESNTKDITAINKA
jgi:FkbM family methyltransferase